MNPLRHLRRLTGLLGPALALVGCHSLPAAAFRLPPESAAHRELQTRRFDNITESELLSAGAGVMQDPGFTLAATLETVIPCGGPGSWKREAYWDECVVTIKNPGDQPLILNSVTLLDPLGTAHGPGTAPWLLEKKAGPSPACSPTPASPSQRPPCPPCWWAVAPSTCSASPESSRPT